MIGIAKGCMNFIADDQTKFYEETFVRQVEAAFRQQQMDEDTYRELMSETCSSSDRTAILEHYTNLFSQLIDYHTNRLLERITVGAAFIEQLDKNDPRYIPAMTKYDKLCASLMESTNRKQR